MACFVYILKCADSSFYTGITNTLEKRIEEHNARVRSSLQKSKLPVKLIYWEKLKTRRLAAQREKVIKGWRREKKLALIKEFASKS